MKKYAYTSIDGRDEEILKPFIEWFGFYPIGYEQYKPAVTKSYQFDWDHVLEYNIVRFPDTWENSAPEISAIFNRFVIILEPGDIIIVTNSGEPAHRAIHAAANFKGARCFYYEEFWFKWTKQLSEKPFQVISPELSRIIYCEDKLPLSINSWYEEYKASRSSKYDQINTEELKSDHYDVFVPGQMPYDSNLMTYHNGTTPELIALEFAKIGKKVCYKVHPGMLKDSYSLDKRIFDNKNIDVYREIHVGKLIEASSIVHTVTSTVGVEASLFYDKSVNYHSWWIKDIPGRMITKNHLPSLFNYMIFENDYSSYYKRMRDLGIV